MKFKSLILLLAAPALLLCACQKTRVAQQAENISRELTDGHIVFSASADAATRAVQGSMTESTAATVQSGGFKVAGVIGTDTYFNETASWDGTNSWYATEHLLLPDGIRHQLLRGPSCEPGHHCLLWRSHLELHF